MVSHCITICAHPKNTLYVVFPIFGRCHLHNGRWPNAPTARVATACGSENSGHFCRYPRASAAVHCCFISFLTNWVCRWGYPFFIPIFHEITWPLKNGKMLMFRHDKTHGIWGNLLSKKAWHRVTVQHSDTLRVMFGYTQTANLSWGIRRVSSPIHRSTCCYKKTWNQPEKQQLFPEMA